MIEGDFVHNCMGCGNEFFSQGEIERGNLLCYARFKGVQDANC